MFCSLSALSIKNSGVKMDWNGIISAASIITNSTFFKGKSKREKPNPASVLSRIVPNTVSRAAVLLLKM